MFPNNSKFEIFSLPKIIGSVQGGLIFSRDTDFISFIKKEQKRNFNLGIYQSNQKFLDIKKEKTLILGCIMKPEYVFGHKRTTKY